MTLYVGVMSGTSMDAVDASLVDIDDAGARVVASAATAFPPALRARLAAALDTPSLTALECWRLDAELGELLADAVQAVLAAAGVDAGEVAGTGSHGQTVYHAPEDDPPLTVQLGDPNIIAVRTGIVTVSDFRRMDLAAGGQGAPLAPAFHAFVFGSAEEVRAVLNLGGIANLSVLPASSGVPITGFDTGPGNTLMDLWALRHLDRPFDEGGRMAAAGTVDRPLLEAMLADPYFSRPAPKSTGREYFNQAWLDRWLCGRPGLSAPDVQSTLCQLTVETAARAVEGAAGQPQALFVCGGGALNGELMSRLGERLHARRVLSTQALGLPPKDVECAAFAWLASRRLERRPAAYPSVTGARRPTLLGGVYRP